MVETRQQQQTNQNSSSNNERHMLWTHVVQSRRKGNSKKQQIVSFNPTLVHRPVTEAESSQNAINGTSPPGPIAVVRPFIKGMEQDSVLIDLTSVKDRSLLNKALLQFNEGTENSDYYEDFLGYRKQTRNYLGHDFLETMWLSTALGRKTLIETGITLEDGTFVKGFPSYPADATIVRLKMENLPFLPAIQLKEEMAKRLSCFGDVLDHGISRTDGIFHGEGYATINLTLAAIPANECLESHADGSSCPGRKHLEPLARVIIWNPRDVEQRKILLQWDKMPDFCRNCQSTDHCRADCPDYKKWVRCYHCNQTGHVFKNCSRNGNIESAPAKMRAVENPPSKQKGRKAAKESTTAKKSSGHQSSPPLSVQGSEQVEKRIVDGDHIMDERDSHQDGNQGPEQPNLPPTEQDRDLVMDESNPLHTGGQDPEQINTPTADGAIELNEQGTPAYLNTPVVTDGDALKTISRDIQMHGDNPHLSRSPPLDPTKAIKKAARTDSSTDISYMRQQANASTASNNSGFNDDNNLIDKDNDSAPAQTGQQPHPRQ